MRQTKNITHAGVEQLRIQLPALDINNCRAVG